MNISRQKWYRSWGPLIFFGLIIIMGPVLPFEGYIPKNVWFFVYAVILLVCIPPLFGGLLVKLFEWLLPNRRTFLNKAGKRKFFIYMVVGWIVLLAVLIIVIFSM